MKVEIFHQANGVRIAQLIAHHGDVQDKLSHVAGVRANRARGVLAAHRHGGFAKISVERVANLRYGLTDRFVVLDDEADLKAALTIEYGRKGPRSKMEGVAPLRTAFPEIRGD